MKKCTFTNGFLNDEKIKRHEPVKILFMPNLVKKRADYLAEVAVILIAKHKKEESCLLALSSFSICISVFDECKS